MTKEIREKVANIIAKGRKDECISLDIAERIIILLDSQGVVMKVDRELPELSAGKHDYDYIAGYNEARYEMVEAGYVATKSLIGGSSPPTFRGGSTLAEIEEGV